jgi:hypothetical protein
MLWEALDEALAEGFAERVSRNRSYLVCFATRVLFFLLKHITSQLHLVECYSCHDFVDLHLQSSDQISFDYGYGGFTWFSRSTDDDDEITSQRKQPTEPFC